MLGWCLGERVSACSSIAFVLILGDARPLTVSQDFLVLERKMGQTDTPSQGVKKLRGIPEGQSS